MKTLMSIAFLCFFSRVLSQHYCNLESPDLLRISEPIIYGIPSIVTIYGGTRDSNSWFSLYQDYCCEQLLHQTPQDTFSFIFYASEIIWVRIESFCDTSNAVGIDIDVIDYPLSVSPIVHYEKTYSGILYTLDGIEIGSFNNYHDWKKLLQQVSVGMYIVCDLQKNTYRKIVKLHF